MTPTKAATKTPAKPAAKTASRDKSAGFSADEKAAMKELLAERKLEERMNKDREIGERALLDVLAKMPQPDRGIAQRLHALGPNTDGLPGPVVSDQAVDGDTMSPSIAENVAVLVG